MGSDLAPQMLYFNFKLLYEIWENWQMKQWITPNEKYIQQTQLLLCIPYVILGCSAVQTIRQVDCGPRSEKYV